MAEIKAETAPRDVRARVLAAVANLDITRTPRGLRWWLDEERSRTLTDAEKRHLRAMVAEGRVRFEKKAGQRDGRRGYYEINRAFPPAKGDDDA